ncbi:carbon-nitrogen hydrolase family protein [Pontibacter sp. G13]|uniref:carbon-nitrogen hydrolase family protein n=1 Tax=Pontibacter sp. G13 TaxID=3074898 RepID=UPI002889C5F2|nr:carbon-nitrogen hydrolase family protein [Pontibacter sp. G13]WNJ18614.1 carbon-nitrogen hydrolase family protein [Pontibacter sp. G13]
MPQSLTVALAQIAPIWLDRERTLDKMIHQTGKAAQQGAQLIAFGEALLPGYPFWLEPTHAANFNDPIQQDLHAHYLDQAVQIEAGHLDRLREACADHQIAAYVGCIERPQDRAGHTAYCSLVYIDPRGEIQSVHRKLMPTYEERLSWGIGDGHGLRTHSLGDFTVGGLNCWENWMPMARATMYAQGVNVHIAVWPGGPHNTQDITRFIAQEGRTYVLSVSGLMRQSDIGDPLPHADLIRQHTGDWLARGGSCIAAPDGSWLVEPVNDREELLVAALDLAEVRKARQNFDPSGHYARPDVFQLKVDRKRQGMVDFGE